MVERCPHVTKHIVLLEVIFCSVSHVILFIFDQSSDYILKPLVVATGPWRASQMIHVISYEEKVD